MYAIIVRYGVEDIFLICLRIACSLHVFSKRHYCSRPEASYQCLLPLLVINAVLRKLTSTLLRCMHLAILHYTLPCDLGVKLITLGTK